MSDEKGDRKGSAPLPPPGWKRNPVLLGLARLDRTVSNAVSLAIPGRPLAHLAPTLNIIEKFGHSLLAMAYVLFFWWMSVSMESVVFYSNILLAMFIDGFLVALLKATFRRVRPLPPSEGQSASSLAPSFPSGAASRFTLLSVILFSPSVALSVVSSGLLLPLLAALLAASVAKILLSVVFVGDTIAGVLNGLFVYWITTSLLWMTKEDLVGLEAFFGGQLGDS